MIDIDEKKKKQKVWTALTKARRRCENPKDPAYPRYGGRGIEYRIKNTQELVDAIGWPPELGRKCSIDRIDTNGHYEVGNLRWADATEQANNTRQNRMIEYNGETKTLSQWCRIIGFSQPVMIHRLRKMSVEEAFTAPHKHRVFEFNGTTKTIREWSEYTGIKYNCLRKRFNQGWDADKALTTPSGGL